MNISIIALYKTSIIQVFYYLNKIMKLFFMIRTYSTLLHVKLILHPLNCVIEKLSHIKLSYILLGRKLGLIYWIMKVLQSLLSLMQSQIRNEVVNFQNMIRKMCWSFISMNKSLSQFKAHLMNSSAIRLHVGNLMSISVYSEGRATRGKILKRFVPDLIKSDL